MKKEKNIPKKEKMIDKDISEIRKDKKVDEEKDISKEENETFNKEKEELKEEPVIDEEISKNLKNKQNKQLKWAVIIMILGLVIIIAIPLIYNNFFKEFNYNSIKFQKTIMGKIIFYSTSVPLVNNEGKIYSEYLVNFREEPKKLNYIKINLSEDETINFVKAKPVYISLDDNLPICPDNLIAVVNLAAFLTSFGGLDVNGALNNKTAANETHVAYANCENSPNNTVIRIKTANETIITKVGPNCYELKYKECEINKVTEKFSLIIIDRYMDYFELKKSSWLDIFKFK